jgi:hypothetical protein
MVFDQPADNFMGFNQNSYRIKGKKELKIKRFWDI